MHPRFAQFPRALAEKARIVRLGPSSIPALLVHPDWDSPAPALLWLHGRTVSKELDPGRYLRLMRAGIASVAIDLPGHGEREGPGLHAPEHSVEVVGRAVGEIDEVLDALRAPPHDAHFDTERLAIGGMSAGGMVTLRRLCEPHPFRAALVEATSGRLTDLYFPGEGASGRPWPVAHERDAVEAIDPSRYLEGWRPVPLLALHASGDEVVPLDTQREFIEDLRRHYRDRGADPDRVRLITFDRTGAPREHAGFGRHGAAAKDAGTEFLVGALRPGASA